MNLLDFIFPKKCVGCKKFGEFICSDCFSKIKFNDIFVCPVCTRPSVNGVTHPNCSTKYSLDGCISAVVYKNVTKRLIYQFKYNPHLHGLDKTLGELMCEALSQNESFYKFVEEYKPVLVPIPLSKKRYRARGYNHAELLASYVAQYFDLKMNSKILIRIKETAPQFKLNRQERIKNMENAFGILPNIKIPESIILVDDIATSFTTLKETAKVLKHKGAKKVIAATFAREI